MLKSAADVVDVVPVDCDVGSITWWAKSIRHSSQIGGGQLTDLILYVSTPESFAHVA